MRLAQRIAIAIALAAAAVPAAADSSRLDAIVAASVIRVGTTGDYKPYTFLDKAGDRSGFDVEMARALGEALGVQVAFVPTTWPNLAHDLQSGAFDIAMGGVSITPERQAIGVFSDPYLRDGKTPIARCADRSKYQTLSDIDRPGVRVIVNPGGTNERFDRARLHQAEIVVQPDNASIFDTLAAGGADVMITDASETRLQQTLHPGTLCAIHPETPFEVAQKAYWMPPDPALEAAVDRWLRKMKDTGALEALETKWLP
ncbi:cyclohexadienyl dehydratase [Roseiarcus fermentans]|uniref:Cyclohexadienyl dehydratase n=1 Tax=Roseiarcus fermentans TaxID=1473586 RepID=A0A366FM86_9HYPH|nr:transporter substrate-binding domain-containing protein [Roseiarcus fermentans]RBP15762.1 cyclohexadienyl dehydratase [Roseiarcus fermentans]